LPVTTLFQFIQAEEKAVLERNIGLIYSTALELERRKNAQIKELSIENLRQKSILSKNS
jgi:hypothetical protein